ncbi:hypothetical protein CCR80_01345 [Rhodothalassium salexigens]|uniref:enoyl-CoA hydratase/isomerase family protein n=1 Tax=Rhodothalassium salexigens TaxID=1086 RepID=UPI0019131A04|nr:enoyl-CoA hydratase-related protein [Rhodothalassium salexigens]MBK5919680.1 hypothetical protein [Rhodothalassium salexigens]
MVATVRLEIDAPAARLVYDRPAMKNAFSREMWAAVPDLVAEAAAAPGVRALVLASATPGIFAAGADLAEFEAFRDDPAGAAANQRAIRDAGRAVADCPVPVIAAIDGPCIGGGYILAGAADIRLASDRARFGFPPAKLGLLYNYEDLVRLVDLIGPGQAKRLLFTARQVDADEALRIGLVDERAPTDAFDARLDALVAEIAGLSAASIRVSKAQVDAALAGQRAETQAIVDSFVTMHRGADHGEGLTAFREKRRPRF